MKSFNPAMQAYLIASGEAARQVDRFAKMAAEYRANGDLHSAAACEAKANEWRGSAS